ncbi:ABC transporter permease subunit [Planobispora longispora]|uniref:ABC transporter n=1 Tax=Planobispora longispora TaxID=28887 RepID=A0A8J3RMR6_9ACTN|nr:ABC transporter permease subunit [Planobispora longispora]BFE85274.1 ABC transporter permease subunit [Planobispora longispora]GIH75088.1 ABC transporter [Planobispora longispora]
MSVVAARAVLAAEWVKIRTLRSTVSILLLGAALSAGPGYLLGLSFSGNFAGMSRERPDSPDLLFATFYSLTIGQLPLVTFAVLAVGGEYASGTIRASLTAVPRRGAFYGGKMLAVALTALGVAAVAVPATFFAAQAGLGPYGMSLDAAGVPQAILGSCLYLTLICVFAAGVTAMLRSSTFSLGILLPLLFLGSQGLGNIPQVKAVTQYLPDQAGMVIMHLTGPSGDPNFGRPYGPWAGMGIVTLWAAAALVGGYLTLRRRDA